MNRRSFISWLAITPIGVWVAAKLPAPRTSAVGGGENVVVQSSQPVTITLPHLDPWATSIRLSNPYSQITVVKEMSGGGEWQIPVGSVREFVPTKHGWIQVG